MGTRACRSYQSRLPIQINCTQTIFVLGGGGGGGLSFEPPPFLSLSLSLSMWINKLTSSLSHTHYHSFCHPIPSHPCFTFATEQKKSGTYINMSFFFWAFFFFWFILFLFLVLNQFVDTVFQSTQPTYSPNLANRKAVHFNGF